MKKIIKYFFAITFVLICSCTIVVNADTNTTSYEKIEFNADLSYDNFINEIDNNTNINVIIKFSSINDLNAFDIPNIFEQIYVSSSSPYLTFTILGKPKFLESFSYIETISRYEFVEQITIFTNISEINTNESSTSEGVNNYTWQQVLEDVGIDLYLIPNYSEINIGMIENGVVNKDEAYFKNMNIYTQVFNNEEFKYKSHTNAVCCLINEITKNVNNTNIYSGQINYNYFPQSIIYLLDWFECNDVKIINLSWGYNASSDIYKRIDELFDYYAATYNMIFIKASGNNSASFVTSPGYGKNIITVGAIDSNWNIYEKSNYSAMFMKPILVAPGKNITDINSDNIIYEDENKNTGTSFSTAITTGIVALLYLEFPNYFCNIENVITSLSAGCIKLNKTDLSYNEKSGFGLINYKKTKDLIENNRITFYNSCNGNQINYNINMDSNSCIDLIVATKGYTQNNIKELILSKTNLTMKEQLEYIQENASDDITIPKIKLIITRENEVIYEEENIENVLFVKIENIYETEKQYQIQITFLDSVFYPISISTRDYGDYISYESSEIHSLESYNDLITHELIANSHSYYCEQCNYIKMNESNIITDQNFDGGYGSEVSLNNGEYGGYTITQGYTRLLFLQGKEVPSTSRLNYNWYSSNAEVAHVSKYGTVTALYVDKPTWVTITAIYKTDNEVETNIVYYRDLLILPDLSSEIKVFNYEVEMKVSESYVFKLSQDRAPTLSMLNYTWNVPCQKDESAGVAISKWGTITALATGEMYINGWYNYNPNILITIKVIVT